MDQRRGGNVTQSNTSIRQLRWQKTDWKSSHSKYSDILERYRLGALSIAGESQGNGKRVGYKKGKITKGM